MCFVNVSLVKLSNDKIKMGGQNMFQHYELQLDTNKSEQPE